MNSGAKYGCFEGFLFVWNGYQQDQSHNLCFKLTVSMNTAEH